MKIKRPKNEWKVVRANEGGQTKWYAGERSYKQGGQLILTGKVIDLTESIEPYLNHSNADVNLLTTMIALCIEDNIKLRGLTVTERDKITAWNHLKERAAK